MSCVSFDLSGYGSDVTTSNDVLIGAAVTRCEALISCDIAHRIRHAHRNVCHQIVFHCAVFLRPCFSHNHGNVVAPCNLLLGTESALEYGIFHAMKKALSLVQQRIAQYFLREEGHSKPISK